MRHCKNANIYVFDLDNFKEINDTYGHATGDSLLKLFARLLNRFFSKNTIIGRMGGDEFAVYEYQPADYEQSVQTILALKEQYRQDAAKLLSHHLTGYSVGIASQSEQNLSFAKLFNNADRALYQAKQMGRNTYSWYEA